MSKMCSHLTFALFVLCFSNLVRSFQSSKDGEEFSRETLNTSQNSWSYRINLSSKSNYQTNEIVTRPPTRNQFFEVMQKGQLIDLKGKVVGSEIEFTLDNFRLIILRGTIETLEFGPITVQKGLVQHSSIPLQNWLILVDNAKLLDQKNEVGISIQVVFLNDQLIIQNGIIAQNSEVIVTQPQINVLNGQLIVQNGHVVELYEPSHRPELTANNLLVKDGRLYISGYHLGLYIDVFVDKDGEAVFLQGHVSAPTGQIIVTNERIVGDYAPTVGASNNSLVVRNARFTTESGQILADDVDLAIRNKKLVVQNGLFSPIGLTVAKGGQLFVQDGIPSIQDGRFIFHHRPNVTGT